MEAMRFAADVLAAFAALEHLGFLVLEMFYWTKPIGLRIFRLTPEAARSSAVLALNQGLYNGFLAAGLAWGLIAADPLALPVKSFFLACMVVAGVVGAATVSPRVLLVQAGPAALALLLLRLSR